MFANMATSFEDISPTLIHVDFTCIRKCVSTESADLTSKRARKKRRETEGGGPEIYISALNWKKRFKLWEDVLVLKRTFFFGIFSFSF